MHPMVNIALRAARSASQKLTRMVDRPDLLKITGNSAGLPETNIQHQIEKVLLEALHTTYPDHNIHGRIGGPADHNRDNAEINWYLDPVDGIFNLIQGLPGFSICISCEIKGRVEHAIVLNPLLQEEFSASRGQGARLNDVRIRVSHRQDLDKAFIALNQTGERSTTALTAVPGALLEAGYEIRISGCSSLDLCYAAAGRLDAVCSLGTHAYALLPGSLIFQEAGGLTSDLQGGQQFLDRAELVATSPRLLKPLLQSISRLQREH